MDGWKNERSPSPASSVDSRWADGLRGIASLFVVSSHLCLCFARSVVPPATGMDGPMLLFQRPFLRLIGQGNAAVAIFFVLLGFVNSLKPIQQSRSGDANNALPSLASSSFRRTGRLVFPAATVTMISWALCQLGFLNLARSSNAYWLIATTPSPSPSWSQAVRDLIHELVFTWVDAENRYDQPQWALLHLLRGSMTIYMVFLATSNATPTFRLSAEIILYVWSWLSKDALVLLNVFAGMILAEISYLLPSPRRRSSRNMLAEIPSYLCAVLGLYLCSFPEHFGEQRPWSRGLMNAGFVLFGEGSDLGRFWAAIGAQLLCLGILTSPSMRRALSSRPLHWLGAVSYSLYLVHGTLIRTVMTWMIFGPMALMSSARVQKDFAAMPLIDQPPTSVIVAMLVLFLAILLASVRLWSVKVEPLFGKLTAQFEQFARDWRNESQRGRDRMASMNENEGRYDNKYSLPLCRPSAGPERQPHTPITTSRLGIGSRTWENAIKPHAAVQIHHD